MSDEIDEADDAVGRALEGGNRTVAVAESLTGGLLANALARVEGSGDWFRGGVVAYATEVKCSLLGLPQEDCLEHGVVSEPVAKALAAAACRVVGAAWGVGITGYAGDGPTVPEGDVGLVWYAVAGPEGQLVAESARFGAATPREAVKLRATQVALALLRRCLLGMVP